MDTARYVIAVLIVVMMPPALIWWFLVHPFVDFWRRFGPKTTLSIMGIASGAAMLGLAALRDRLVGPDLGTRVPLLVVAGLLLASSARIAMLRRRHLTSRILSGIPELEEGGGGTLLTDGVYGRIRHPRYVEVAVGTFAYASFANYGGAWLVGLLTLPVLHAIVLLEERELADRFGAEYEAYRARVPRYLPRPKRVSGGGGAAA